MQAKSIKGESPEKLKKLIADCMADGFNPTLAIVFQSVSQDISAVTKVFDDFGIVVYGATTNGELIDDELSEKSIVALLLDLKKDYFKIYFDEYDSITQLKPPGKSHQIL